MISARYDSTNTSPERSREHQGREAYRRDSARQVASATGSQERKNDAEGRIVNPLREVQ